jgi:peptidyl-prolyl cis-trans isomerase C
MKWLIVLCVLASCEKRTEKSSSSMPASAEASTRSVVARVGPSVITEQSLLSRMEEQGASKDRFKDLSELRALLDNEIRFELLAVEAARRGFDRDPQVQEAAKKAMVQKMLGTALGDASKVPADDVKAFYERNIGEYRQLERVQVALLKVETAQQAHQVRERLQRQKDAMAFTTLRAELGQESNRDLELKYWSKEELEASFGPELSQAAFATQELGALGPIVRTSHGFYVFRLTGRRAAFHRAIADVEESIRLRLFRQKRSEAFDDLVRRLRDETPVTVDEVVLRHMLQ